MAVAGFEMSSGYQSKRPPASQLRRLAMEALALFWVTRLALLALIAVWGPSRHKSILDLLTKADGIWYRQIALHGYAPPPPIGPTGVYLHTTDLAFFPLYPNLVRPVALFVDIRLAEVIVSLVAGSLAALLLAVWASRWVGQRGALTVVCLWSLFPSAAVLSMGYTEGLFVALALAVLLALEHDHWGYAALACALAGLTRPSGLALLAAMGVAAALQRPFRWSRILATAIGSLGLLISLGHVALVTHRWDGWFWLERTVWRSGFDGGRQTLTSTWNALLQTRSIREPFVVSSVVVICFVAFLIWYLTTRPAWPPVVYVVLVAAMSLGGVNYFHCKPRFLLAAFPVLLPVGRRISRLPKPVLAGGFVLALTLSTWWNAWLVVAWPASI